MLRVRSKLLLSSAFRFVGRLFTLLTDFLPFPSFSFPFFPPCLSSFLVLLGSNAFPSWGSGSDQWFKLGVVLV